MTAGSIRHDGTVLTGVKAKPFGWPPASPDPGSGRRILATIEAAAPTPTKIKFQLRGVSTVRGDCRVRVQFAKVAEFQRRGIIHFHALIRLDGPPTDAEAYPPPAVDLDSGVLVNLVRSSAVDIWYDAPPLDQDDARRRLRFGAQLDAQPVTGAADRNTHSTQLHPETVAAYIAKYATKAADDFGLAPHRIEPGADLGALPVSAHIRRLLATAMVPRNQRADVADWLRRVAA
jgi:hypothetical protein